MSSISKIIFYTYLLLPGWLVLTRGCMHETRFAFYPLCNCHAGLKWKMATIPYHILIKNAMRNKNNSEQISHIYANLSIKYKGQELHAHRGRLGSSPFFSLIDLVFCLFVVVLCFVCPVLITLSIFSNFCL